ncbi:alpha-1,3-mannosyl-glycoprotein 2-beta-N-acetylglucosaminyltransferase [Euwallacea fornicatus]|uniref:alpha-1,3-mannosyl-glycoprotein 2-beta-N-acetylglucosaminyltransferase n=1 Tax=Euwallacea fornicatus TaxID=995702 RepID=UPI00338F6655
MRVKRTVFAFVCVATVWLTVLFLVFSNNFGEQNRKNLYSQIVQLEEGIQHQFKSNNEIIKQTREFLDKKKQVSQELLVKEQGEDEVSNGELMVNPKAPGIDSPEGKLPILVFACNRVSVGRCLDKLLQYRPDSEKFPIIVTQDCDHDETANKIRSYGSQLTLIQQPDQSDIQVPPKEKKFKGYFKIARHYGWALNQMFFNFNFSTVIVVEDDLEIAPDFYEYFLGTYPLLQKDPTLWCVSAWNDNGKEGLVNAERPDLLYRTDFFPGLGWMMTRNLWLELYSKWPRSYWDDWIREPAQRKERSCIRPEISRTKTFGKIGVSNGMYFEKHLKYIKLNEESVPFSKMNLTYLLKENYDKDFVGAVYKCPVVNYEDLRNNNISFNGPVRITYRKLNEYKIITKKLGLMDDFRGGVPRMAYKGIITFHYKGRTVHLAPSVNWKGYELSWS